MATIVQDIISHLESETATILGVSFSKLSHVLDVGKNKFKGSNKRYGVRPLGMVQNDDINRAYTVDQTFEVIITNGYKSSKLISDMDQQTKGIELQQYGHDIFLRLKTTNGLADIKQIFNMDMGEPEHDEDNKVVIVRMSFSVKYHQRY